MIKSYFCKECLKRHKIDSNIYKKHKQFAFNETSGQMPDTVLVKIFRLDKILDDEVLFKKLMK